MKVNMKMKMNQVRKLFLKVKLGYFSYMIYLTFNEFIILLLGVDNVKKSKNKKNFVGTVKGNVK